jgi:hypothetical protein
MSKSQQWSDASMPHDAPIIVFDHNNWIGNTTFTRKGAIYQISDIVAIQSASITTTYNFLPSYDARFFITLSDKRVIHYHGSSMLIKTQRVQEFHKAYELLCKLSFAHRADIYLSQFQNRGWFQYRTIFIYANGDIKHKTKTVNIAEAALTDGVVFGFKFGSILTQYSSYNPSVVSVCQKIHGKFLKEHISFELEENRDVLQSILIHLAELRGGTVRFISG